MKIKKYLPIIGILIFLYILFRLDLSNIINEIRNAKINYLSIALLLVFLSTLTQTLKWFTIIKIQKIKLPFWDSYKINLMSTFYGFITPSKIGSAIRIDYLRKYQGYHLGKGASNYILEKVLDLCSLFVLAVMFSFVFEEVIPKSFIFYSTVLLIILLSLLIIFRDKERTRYLLRIIYQKMVPEKIKEKVKKGFHSFYDEMPKKRYLILFFLVNILNWVVLYTMSFFIGLSLGINLSFFYFLAIMPIATLVGQIPITISGLGTREATMISLFGLLGIDATKVFSMALIALFGGIIPAIIGSILILRNR